MLTTPLSSELSRKWKKRRSRKVAAHRRQRRLLPEPLESRQLLSGSPYMYHPAPEEPSAVATAHLVRTVSEPDHAWPMMTISSSMDTAGSSLDRVDGKDGHQDAGSTVDWANVCRRVEGASLCEVQEDDGLRTWLDFGIDGTMNVGTPSDLELIQSTAEQLTLGLAVEGVWVENVELGGTEFAQLTIPEAGYTATIGEPLLPVIRRLVAVPEGVTLSVEMAGRPETLALAGLGIDDPLAPVQAPVPKLPGAVEDAAFAIDAEAFKADRSLPEARVNVVQAGYLAGQKLMMLEVAPIAYNPLQETITVYDTLTVHVGFEGENATASELSPREDRWLADIALNHKSSEEAKSAGNLLIIAHEDFAGQLGTFVAHKSSRGWNVHVADTSTIGETADDIRAYVRSQYAGLPTRPDAVLLVGDTDRIPHFVGSGSDNPATDLYYGCMDDGDDWYPEIPVGRFSVADETQLSDVIEKTITYETSPSDTWTKRATFMAGVDNSQVSEGTHNYAVSTHMDPLGYTSAKLYQTTYGATTNDVRDSFNGGTALGVYSGHGSVYSWADGPPFSQSDVLGLTNVDAYPVVASFACVTGAYTEDESFMETWLRAPEKGAVVAVGSSVNSFWGADDILERRLFDAIYDEGHVQTGSAWNRAKERLLEHYGPTETVRRYFEMYNVLGDPTVEVAGLDFGIVSPHDLPVAYLGEVYEHTLEAGGGTPPYTWSLVDGALPPGLSLDQNTGRISGTPDVASDATFTILATDRESSAERAFRLVVVERLEIVTPVTLPDAALNQPYNVILQAHGGAAPYTWSVVGAGIYDETDPGAGYLGGGTAMGWNADDRSWSLSLPWSFPFYGTEYTSVNVCSNGFLDFTSPDARYLNSQTELLSSVRIAPLWDDLRTDGSGEDIYVTTTDEYVAIRWDGRRYTAAAEPVDFEAVLYRNGEIQFNYGLAHNGPPPTIGVSAGNGTDFSISMRDGATTIAANVSSLYVDRDPLPEGLSLDETTGDISGTPVEGGSFDITINVHDSSEPQQAEQRQFTLQANPGLALSEIRGSTWNDLDDNGVWDDAEPGLANWQIYLDLDGDGQLGESEPTALTDANGAYAFSDLEPGTYTIAEVPRTGWQQSYPGGDGVHDVTVDPGQTLSDADFGNRLIAHDLAIVVGAHVLLPNTPGQVIPICVSGGLDVQGVVLNVQIADGYADVPGSVNDGPNITNIDLVGPDTVFGGVANTGANFIETREQIWIVGTATTSGAVLADGVLAYVTIDTTGWFGEDGPWTLKLTDTYNNDTNFQTTEGMIVPTVSNGSIRIDNLPAADAGGPYTVAEGSSTTLDGSGSTDPDPDDRIADYQWDLDQDGIFGETGAAAARGDELGVSPSFTAAGLDGPDTWTVSLRVIDGHGGISSPVTTQIAVTNVAPVLVDLSATSIEENGMTTLAGTIIDPGTLDTFTVQVDWGDGSPSETFAYAAGTTGISEMHPYLDDDPSGTATDTYTITVTVSDDDMGSNTETAALSVSNVSPGINPVADRELRRVESLDLQSTPVTFGDAGTLDLHTATIDWGDGSSPESASVVEPVGASLGEVHATHIYSEGGLFTVTITVTDDDLGSDTTMFLVDVIDARVVTRHVFYNNSAWDSNNSGANADDDNAIAPHVSSPDPGDPTFPDSLPKELAKRALLPGETATFANYTSYSRGLNGIMIDIDGLTGTPTTADFDFRVGNDDDPSSWNPGPAPQSVSVRPGAGVNGADRITLIWADNDPYTPEREPGSISGQWLQVTVLATENTGLAEDDVFYFGNAIGESGNSTVEANVDTNDEIGARNHPHSLFAPATIDDAYDYDRDQRVDTNDEILARNNSTSAFDRLRLITVYDDNYAMAAIDAQKPGFSEKAGFLSNNRAQFAVDTSQDGEGENLHSATEPLVIDIGQHVLFPERPNQVIPIEITGSVNVQGVVLNVQVADAFPDAFGSRQDGPDITDVDLTWPGTVFGSVSNTGPNVIETREQMWIVGTSTSSGAVPADGILANLTFDTAGWQEDDGPWPLRLADTFNGDTNFQTGTGPVVPMIINGTIKIGKRWHNAGHVADVNGDTVVSPLDVLHVISALNIEGTMRLPADPSDSLASLPYVDTNNDGYLTPLDVLLAVNEVNRLAGAQGHHAGEGESLAVSHPLDETNRPSPRVLGNSSGGRNPVSSKKPGFYPAVTNGSRRGMQTPDLGSIPETKPPPALRQHCVGPHHVDRSYRSAHVPTLADDWTGSDIEEAVAMIADDVSSAWIA
ncbi:MAG: putative Ig domain-containing protein [Pirellulaceae bacterium]|nr:putative Ig domain-containing protein [Pirellulaceae bacterium]